MPLSPSWRSSGLVRGLSPVLRVAGCWAGLFLGVNAGRSMRFGFPELLEPDSAGDKDPAGSRAAKGPGRGAADPNLGSEPQP